MPNSYFDFKQFRINQGQCGMKVTTDGCFFGAVIETAGHQKVLDIGTGTGLLSLMIAQRNPELKIDAVELDEAAFTQARQNFSNSPWSESIHIFHSPIQVFQPNTKYDLIVCNPPFFRQSMKGDSPQKNKAIHNESLSFEDLVSNIDRLLTPSGTCWIMYPAYEMSLLCTAAKTIGFYPSTEIILRNKEGKPVFRSITSFKRKVNAKSEPIHMTIRDQEHQYTPSFKKLLQPFYLNL
jgi:tRNA1Val (adenine37-N6)-methyltransferase